MDGGVGRGDLSDLQCGYLPLLAILYGPGRPVEVIRSPPGGRMGGDVH